ncbi:MAG TPA: anti-sigma factor [Gemmatimonadaceae bacterium]|nr:anti-sigma factor [Gemmatimonadaceae bacterium]
MTDMTHEEALSELAAVALDAVPAEVAEAVRAHASVCPECGPELAAMEATVAALGQLAPAQAMNTGRGAGIRSRLVTRARSERESQRATVSGTPDLSRGVASITGLGHKITPVSQRAIGSEAGRSQSTPPQPSRPIGAVRHERGRGSAMTWLALAATVALVATGAQLMRVTAERNSIRESLAARDTASGSDSLAALVVEKDATIAAMAGPDVKVVALTNESARQPLGRMFWNRASNDWTMITYGLRSPRPGMTYQVWLVTDDAKISAGTFKPDAQGKTVMHANYVMAPNALRAVAITEEPEGGVPAPTGPMVVTGSATL